MSRQGFSSPHPSWPPSTSPCHWWRGGRTCWRSARTSWSPPSKHPAASGCLPRSSAECTLSFWDFQIGWASVWTFSHPGAQLHICPPAVQGDLYCHLQVRWNFIWSTKFSLLMKPPSSQFALGEHSVHYQERGSSPGGEVVIHKPRWLNRVRRRFESWRNFLGWNSLAEISLAEISLAEIPWQIASRPQALIWFGQKAGVFSRKLFKNNPVSDVESTTTKAFDYCEPITSSI